MNLLSQDLEVSSILGIEEASLEPTPTIDYQIPEEEVQGEDYMEPRFLKVEREA